MRLLSRWMRLCLPTPCWWRSFKTWSVVLMFWWIGLMPWMMRDAHKSFIKSYGWKYVTRRILKLFFFLGKICSCIGCRDRRVVRLCSCFGIEYGLCMGVECVDADESAGFIAYDVGTWSGVGAFGMDQGIYWRQVFRLDLSQSIFLSRRCAYSLMTPVIIFPQGL